MTFETAATASACPMTDEDRMSSRLSSLSASSSLSRCTGIPVHAVTTWRMSSSSSAAFRSVAPDDSESVAIRPAVSSMRPRSATASSYRPARSASSRSAFSPCSASRSCWTSSKSLRSFSHLAFRTFSFSRRLSISTSSSVRSCSCSSCRRDSRSISFERISLDSSSSSTGTEDRSIRIREAASSRRSMALSGRNLPEI